MTLLIDGKHFKKRNQDRASRPVASGGLQDRSSGHDWDVRHGY